MSQPYLVATHLAHSFDYPLYRDVSLEIRPLESVAVMGRSGSGKSTLLHTLAGLVEPQEGSVKLMGRDLYRIDESEKEMLRRDRTGIVFQQHYLFKGMTGRENVEIAALLSRQPIDEALFASLEIDRVIDQKVSELSGGQQQRVSLARVLSKKPKVIFADEPTGNLDPETSELVMHVLFDYVAVQKAALFMVTHDPEVAGKCDRIYLLENCRLRSLESSKL